LAQSDYPERPDEEQPEQQRESIWSIPAKYKRWYFGLFTGQMIIATIWLVRTAIVDDTRAGIPEKILFVWQGAAPMAITSAAFALTIIDTWGLSMVLASYLEDVLRKRRQKSIAEARKKALAEGRAAGLAEGHTEGRAEGRSEGLSEGFEDASRMWQEWNRRREAAVAAGEEFTEPPPSTAQTSQAPSRE
jgi:membrane protein implicated in regulation of membrane protease activity